MFKKNHGWELILKSTEKKIHVFKYVIWEKSI